jgi:biopolymer transport protein ExbD
LPKHSEQTLAKQTLNVNIDADENYSISGKNGENLESVNRAELEKVLRSKLASYPKYEATIVINAHEEIPIKDITEIMSIGKRIKQKVILATQPE